MEPLTRISRRKLLQIGTGSAFAALFADQLFADEEARAPRDPRCAEAVIVLWLAGGPSQLETFDPHPGSKIAQGTKSIPTKAKGIQLAAGLEQLAEQMDKLSLLRSLKSREGDHERATYYAKTGYRPNPTVIHPSLGAVACSELPQAGTEIPRHVALLESPWPAWGGYLGDELDAFRSGDPIQRVSDITPWADQKRMARRFKGLDFLERRFARERAAQAKRTLHPESVARARKMMASKQLVAFDLKAESVALRKAYGDNPFGRSCLAARRLVEVGVRWVEVTLDGWDSHINNHETQAARVRTLDPAFATLLKDLEDKDLLRRTLVLCMGEFGRTPKLNALGGRDHWPHGFSLAIGGGPVRAGQAFGETDPAGSGKLKAPLTMADVSASILTALGIPPKTEKITPIGRPLLLAKGRPISGLLALS